MKKNISMTKLITSVSLSTEVYMGPETEIFGRFNILRIVCLIKEGRVSNVDDGTPTTLGLDECSDLCHTLLFPPPTSVYEK